MIMSNKQIENLLFGETDSPQSEERDDFIATIKEVGIIEALWMHSNATDTLIDRLHSLGNSAQRSESRLHFLEERVNTLISKVEELIDNNTK